MPLKTMLDTVNRLSLIAQIVLGLIAGAIIGAALPSLAPSVGILGDLFVGALKAVAPFLVFILVTAAIAQYNQGAQSNIKPVLFLYLIGTFSAAVVGVLVSFLFPSHITLVAAPDAPLNPPTGITAVLKNLLMNLVANPVNALSNANYIGILAWALVLGIALRHASSATHHVIGDLSDAVSKIVRWVIGFAPLGIMGLMAITVAETSFVKMVQEYGRLILVLVGCMAFVAFVVNPLIVFLKIKRNPYPLVLMCLRESGVPAFFTRSSAANIPVNMALARKLNLNADTYSVSIPLGGNHQHGRRGDYDFCVGFGGGAYAGDSSGFYDGIVVKSDCHSQCVRCFGGGRWVVVADSVGLQPV